MSTATLPPAPFTSARNKDGSKEPGTAALENTRQRTNIALNARAWDRIDGLTDEDRQELFWLHSRALDHAWTNTHIGNLLGVDRTNAGRILAGTYPVTADTWQRIVHRIREIRAAATPRPTIGGIEREPDYVPAPAGDILWQGMEFAGTGGFALLCGPSGVGKTRTCTEWDLRNPGRMIRVDVPPIGGTAAFIRTIGRRMGISAKKSGPAILEGLKSNLGPRNVLVCDQGSRLLPNGRQFIAPSLEALMDINEHTGCGIVINLTWRNLQTMADGQYQLEQITGRAEIFRARPVTREQVVGICDQFAHLSRPTQKALHDLAQAPGGLRTVAKILNAATKAARKLNSPVTDQIVAAAIANRFDRAGGEEVFRH